MARKFTVLPRLVMLYVHGRKVPLAGSLLIFLPGRELPGPVNFPLVVLFAGIHLGENRHIENIESTVSMIDGSIGPADHVFHFRGVFACAGFIRLRFPGSAVLNGNRNRLVLFHSLFAKRGDLAGNTFLLFRREVLKVNVESSRKILEPLSRAGILRRARSGFHVVENVLVDWT